MTRYQKDPRWIVARYAGTCQGCAAPIGPGERAFWYPLTRDLFCDSVRCGQREALAFNAAADDEEAYASQYGRSSDAAFDAEWASEREWQYRMAAGCEPVEEPPFDSDERGEW